MVCGVWCVVLYVCVCVHACLVCVMCVCACVVCVYVYGMCVYVHVFVSVCVRQQVCWWQYMCASCE